MSETAILMGALVVVIGMAFGLFAYLVDAMVPISIAGLMEIAAKATGWDPLSTRAFIAESLDKWLVADGRETNDTFNILPRGDVEMIRDAIRWLIFVGAVNKRRAAQLSERFQPDPGWNLESIK